MQSFLQTRAENQKKLDRFAELEKIIFLNSNKTFRVN